jgi:voltage-gated potassium channel
MAAWSAAIRGCENIPAEGVTMSTTPLTSPTDASPSKPQVSATYQFVMVVLCLYALLALAVETTVRIDPQIRGVLEYADYAVCTIFLFDFFLSLWRAPRRLHYFLTWGWLDLLSSFPALDIARWGRIARVLRVLRVLRGLRATKLIAAAVLRRRAQNSFLAASLIALLLVVFSSVAALHFETDPASNIKTAEDAIWWSLTTITTVGYGDRFPVTAEGRFVAAILMCAGVGLFGILSGFLASWFLESGNNSGNAEIEALRQEIVSLREAITHGVKNGTV